MPQRARRYAISRLARLANKLREAPADPPPAHRQLDHRPANRVDHVASASSTAWHHKLDHRPANRVDRVASKSSNRRACAPGPGRSRRRAARASPMAAAASTAQRLVPEAAEHALGREEVQISAHVPPVDDQRAAVGVVDLLTPIARNPPHRTASRRPFLRTGLLQESRRRLCGATCESHAG